ncbi:Fructose-bisphosphate aldolase, cytoplasmic isozyme [Thalictrum thalictroides]|uniref:fructose-bisphosphate aldolase n=1 Tax=Thalictrum thalictroides TaxID=46969 RepID=A0A7J6WGD5_THATH|nr:Fructose-bisphosphate aldolase, cytoplasmic isozyme [Thalictrum thalictroides]
MAFVPIITTPEAASLSIPATISDQLPSSEVNLESSSDCLPTPPHVPSSSNGSPASRALESPPDPMSAPSDVPSSSNHSLASTTHAPLLTIPLTNQYHMTTRATADISKPKKRADYVTRHPLPSAFPMQLLTEMEPSCFSQAQKNKVGDIYDCIDIKRQPTLDHPLYRNHEIQSYFSMIRLEVNRIWPYTALLRNHVKNYRLVTTQASTDEIKITDEVLNQFISQVENNDVSNKVTPELIVEATVTTLCQTVPAAMPGIVFLSGGQSTLKSWSGKKENVAKAQEVFLGRCKANLDATLGKYDSGVGG